MKSFIIYLPDFQSSVTIGNRALESAQKHNWNIELYPGVNGLTATWGDIQPSILDPKCRTMLEKPGVRGCFLSHWKLWNHCININEPIGIFEHDIVFQKDPPDTLNFEDVLKLEGFLKKKPRPAGEWYEGARAYIIKPSGASKLINWVTKNGALPADVVIGLDIVDITLDPEERVIEHALYGKSLKRDQSFTWNLVRME